MLLLPEGDIDGFHQLLALFLHPQLQRAAVDVLVGPVLFYAPLGLRYRFVGFHLLLQLCLHRTPVLSHALPVLTSHGSHHELPTVP